MVEPQRKELNELLWNNPWDIFFFAGHSSSQASGESGRIYINKTDSLTIPELEHGLKAAVNQGLTLSIFNSCDGLGLARQLEDLNIPEIIVMREPVPDVVAQEFLKHFLTAYSGGQPLYRSVREAREKLQGIENEFPCASWLPVICQNLAAVPLTWPTASHSNQSPQLSPPRTENPQKQRAIYCINPECPRPFPQAWEDSACLSCGTPLWLKNRYSARKRLGGDKGVTFYSIWDAKAKTERVLKVLLDPCLKAQKRFEQEAALLARLRHPGIPRGSDSFTVSTSFSTPRILSCAVIEKIQGQTLKEVIDQHPHGFPEGMVLGWFSQAVDTIGELHKHQIIHCDINPSSLMLRQDTKQLTILNFAAAKSFSAAKSKAQSHPIQANSPDYRPPESARGEIDPTGDFYALGRTFIHLLTGKSPKELEDAATGELCWRQHALISPTLGDLLDEMICVEVQRRPGTAADIQLRLAKLSLGNSTPKPVFPAPPASQATNSSIRVPSSSSTSRGMSRSGRVLSQSTTQTLQESKPQTAVSCSEPSRHSTPSFGQRAISWAQEVGRDTAEAMIFSAIGAGVGAGIGFGLYRWTGLGTQLAALCTQLANILSAVLPFSVPVGAAELLMFGLAGLGTAVGLMKSSSFGQSHHTGVSHWIGIGSYCFGWLILSFAVATFGIKSLVIFSALTAAILTFGLSLPSHYLVHAFVTAGGTAKVFEWLITSKITFTKVFWDLLSVSTTVSTHPGWSEFCSSIFFFSFLGCTLALWLGISFYLVVPCLRFLGWR